MTAIRVLRHDERAADPLFDEIRATEFGRLDADNQAYLDYTGSALYSETQIAAHAERMRRMILGNPHSENGPSLVSTAIINEAKARLLGFLDAPASEYVVCFTANATAAIKLVAESFPFDAESPLILSADNHNSMNGVREFARSKGAAVHYVPLDENLRLKGARSMLANTAGNGGLFGYPAQSNFSGVKHSLGLIDTAQRLGYSVLLDAAAFLPTNSLSLRRYPADFVALSIYKITGYPTGVGALVARRDSLAKLERPWFAGGTVEYASVQHGTHMLRESNGESFEDGTPAFLSIAAVSDGLDFLEGIGMDRINLHVTRQANRFRDELAALRNRCGKPLVHFYGQGGPADRGATLAFNLIGSDGMPIPFSRVVERARNEGVSLRGGCFCNPGASESAFEFPLDATSRCFSSARERGFSIERFSECLGPSVPVGALRASMGVATSNRDLERALSVVASFA
jgi:selenocysteine lyase/cysteine desulfurase